MTQDDSNNQQGGQSKVINRSVPITINGQPGSTVFAFDRPKREVTFEFAGDNITLSYEAINQMANQIEDDDAYGD